ncbi:unnamed protein product [Ambrosiozyma monospora]|uniref:Unnamed protein product n=1 Tax=Ambrosiozyma monospora TaxID=43982 RepID=A0ACB5SUH5_AMBMO|nr:unnamed protein product [Ambrosiozyma monospora]
MPGTVKLDHSNKQRQCPSPLRVNIQLSLNPHSSLEFVSLSKSVFNKLYSIRPANYSNRQKTFDVKNKFISLQLLGSSIFKECKVFPITVKDYLPENTIELDSLSILHSYGSEFILDQAVITPISRLPFLKTVVLGFPSEVYELLEHFPKTKLLDILAEERESNVDFVIVRKGDYSNELNGVFLLCEPFDQGYISKNTDIVVSKLKEHKAKNPFLLNENSLGKNQKLDHLHLEFDPFGIDSKYSATPQSFDFFTSPLSNDTLSSYTHCLNRNSDFN